MPAGIESEALEHLALHQPADQRQPDQSRQLGLGHLREHDLLELQVELRHRREQRGPRALLVGDEGVEAFGEKHLVAARQQRVLEVGALDDVRQRQEGQQAIVGAEINALQRRRGGRREVAEAVHDVLGHARGARGVDDRGELIRPAGGRAGQRALRLHRVVPSGEATPRALRREREGDVGQVVGDAGLDRRPVVELADEQQRRAAVREQLAHGGAGERRIQRHGDVAGHPDRPVGHQPMRAVLRDQRDPRTRRHVERAQVAAMRRVSSTASRHVHDRTSPSP